VQVGEPSLTLRLKGPVQTLVGREVDLSVEVANPSTVPVAGAQVTRTLPQGLEFVSTGSAAGSYNAASRSVSWPLGPLAGGQGQTVTVRVKALAAGDWDCPVRATAEGLAEAKGNQAVHVEGAAALSVEVADRNEAIEVGAETVYEVRVINQGSAAGANVRLSAVLPEGLTLVRPEGPTAARVQQQQVLFEPLAQLPPRADAVYRIHVRGQRAGDWRFAADMSADGLQRPVHQEVSTHVYSDQQPGRPTSGK
jgi:uncharacterized repeat protein (TIGR01451 family)